MLPAVSSLMQSMLLAAGSPTQLAAVVAAQAATYRAVPKETVAALEYGMYVCHGKLRLCGQHLDRECLIVGRRLLREEIHTFAQNEQ